jgi:hypothetical protein
MSLFRKNINEVFTPRSPKVNSDFVVLDNLETIFSQEALRRELGDIVTLLDDPAYANFQTRLLIVGIPSGVREYFSRTENRHAVSNRLRELPAVGKLSDEQAAELVRKGICDELKVNLTPITGKLNRKNSRAESRRRGFVSPRRVHRVRNATCAMRSLPAILNHDRFAP